LSPLKRTSRASAARWCRSHIGNPKRAAHAGMQPGAAHAISSFLGDGTGCGRDLNCAGRPNRGTDMSWQPAADPAPGDPLSCDAIATVIVPRARDLGGFEVRRALPSQQRQIAGSLLGQTSPVRTSSTMFYADVELVAGCALPLDPDYEERAVYTVAGTIEIAGDAFASGKLLVFRPGDRITIKAKTAARFMIL